MKVQTLLLLATLTAVSIPASAEIYRWVDAQGRVHYSDRPVPGATRMKDVSSRPSDPEAVSDRVATEQKQREASESAAKDQQATAEAARAVNQDLARLAEERCKKAKEDYRIATESQRLYRVGKDGEREYLTDAELTEARINARKKLEEACGKQGG